MTPFEAYQRFLALKMHFTTNYDAVKYNFKVNANRDSFDVRKDKYFFQKLSKHRDLDNHIIANFVHASPKWIGDLVNEESESIYNDWKKRIESFTYNFNLDLQRLNDDLNTNLKVIDGQHPPLLRSYLRKDVSLESLIVIDDIVKFHNHWNKSIEDTIIWPMIYRKCIKYKPFLHYDRDKCRKIMIERFSNHKG